MLRQADRRHRGCWSSVSRTAGTTSATGSCSTSIQRTRGSRRNHRSCRTANWRVRVMMMSMASSWPIRPVEVLENFLVAERLRRRAGEPRVRRRSIGPRRRVRARSSGGPVRRCVRSARGAAGGCPICTTGAVGVGSPRRGRSELNGRPLPTVTSSARTTRRRLVGSIFAAADGVEPGEALDRGSRCRRSTRVRRAAQATPPAGRSRRRRPGGRGRCRRPGALGRRPERSHRVLPSEPP